MLSLSMHGQPFKFQNEKRIRQLVMLRHTAGMKALKSELERLKADVSITPDR